MSVYPTIRLSLFVFITVRAIELSPHIKKDNFVILKQDNENVHTAKLKYEDLRKTEQFCTDIEESRLCIDRYRYR